jgi:hypothetical protein
VHEAQAPFPGIGTHCSSAGRQVGVGRIQGMALAFGVAVFILGHIHHEAGNRADGDVGAGAGAGLVLIFLIIGFPTPSQFETRLAAVRRERDQAGHLVLFEMAAKGEIGVGGKKAREDANAGGLSEL